MIAESRATTTAAATEKRKKNERWPQHTQRQCRDAITLNLLKGRKKRAEAEKHTGGADKRKGSGTRTPGLSAWSQKAAHEGEANQQHAILKREECHNRNEKQVKLRGRERVAEGEGMARTPAYTAPRKHRQQTNQGKKTRGKDRRRLWRAREGKGRGGGATATTTNPRRVTKPTPKETPDGQNECAQQEKQNTKQILCMAGAKRARNEQQNQKEALH